MNAYVYRAALYCEPCTLRRWPDGTEYLDSDLGPCGPYPHGGGEADTPQHCDECGVFLENPLTQAGREYVQEQLGERESSGFAWPGDDEILDKWAAHYGIAAGSEVS